MSRPELTFSGYEGSGQIKTLVPESGGQVFDTAKDSDGFNLPKSYDSAYQNEPLK